MYAGGAKAMGGMEAVPETGLPLPEGEGLTTTTKGNQHSAPCLHLLPPFAVCSFGPHLWVVRTNEDRGKSRRQGSAVLRVSLLTWRQIVHDKRSYICMQPVANGHCR